MQPYDINREPKLMNLWIDLYVGPDIQLRAPTVGFQGILEDGNSNVEMQCTCSKGPGICRENNT